MVMFTNIHAWYIAFTNIPDWYIVFKLFPTGALLLQIFLHNTLVFAKSPVLRVPQALWVATVKIPSTVGAHC